MTDGRRSKESVDYENMCEKLAENFPSSLSLISATTIQ